MSKKTEFSKKDKKEFNKKYNTMIDNLQIELVQMQDWVIDTGKKVATGEKKTLQNVPNGPVSWLT